MTQAIHAFVICYTLQNLIAFVAQCTYPISVYLQPTDREPPDSQYGFLKDPIQSTLGQHYRNCFAEEGTSRNATYIDNCSVLHILRGVIGTISDTLLLKTLYGLLGFPGHEDDWLCCFPDSLWDSFQPGPADFLLGSPGSHSPPHVVSCSVG